MRLALMALVAATLLGGCLGPPTPRAEVIGVDVEDVTADGARVVVRVAVTNAGEVELPMPKATYTLSVDGLDAFSFTAVPDTVVPMDGGQTVMVLPAAFGLSGLEAGDGAETASGGLAGRGYRVSGSLTYEPPGDLRRLATNYRVPLPFATFDASGVLEP
ncbi:MAG: hypothetical protein AAF823_07340 [Planctomycetota bacterium]